MKILPFKSSGKSAESNRSVIVHRHIESCPEADGVTYMPGVYKMSMVRMFGRTDEPANVRV